jgi:hypothetical protein
LEQFNRWVDNRERAEQFRRIIAAYAAKSLPWSAGEASGIPGMDRTGDGRSARSVRPGKAVVRVGPEVQVELVLDHYRRVRAYF